MTKINHLISGGLITNYYCTSRCRHCLYACSPTWEKKYISPDRAENNILKIKELGCKSIHIGGGEPLLNIEALIPVLNIIRDGGLNINYIETNSSWFKNTEKDRKTLLLLKKHGVNTLLISISPFHNEFIPFKRVRGLIEACNKTGINVFPWIERFIADIIQFDETKSHNLEEYIKKFGDSYILNIPQKYWIEYKGRALNTYKKYFPVKSSKDLLKENNNPCNELFDTNHFHSDLFGNYIPGLCSGLSIEMGDLGENLQTDKYPFLSSLMEQGINGLFDIACEKYDFKTENKYVSKCDLCTDIREFLVNILKIDSPDLKPVDFYKNI